MTACSVAQLTLFAHDCAAKVAALKEFQHKIIFSSERLNCANNGHASCSNGHFWILGKKSQMKEETMYIEIEMKICIL